MNFLPNYAGFNLENSFARFLVYSTFLVNGNPVTNLMSIGDKTSLTGQDPPKPATVAGLDTHNNCEGDTSMTRGMRGVYRDHPHFTKFVLQLTPTLATTTRSMRRGFKMSVLLFIRWLH